MSRTLLPGGLSAIAGFRFSTSSRDRFTTDRFPRDGAVRTNGLSECAGITRHVPLEGEIGARIAPASTEAVEDVEVCAGPVNRCTGPFGISRVARPSCPQAAWLIGLDENE